VIIENGGANLASLRYALDRLGARSLVSADPATVAAAPRVLLPGVGAAADAMERLRAAGLIDCIQNLRQPLLGICLGMQLLFAHSEEGDTAGLGLLPGRVRRLPSAEGQPIPHMGWNTCWQRRESSLLAGLRQDDYFYFAHSYAAPVAGHTLAATAYGVPMSAVVQRQNFHGVQFHPERSAAAGAQLLRNFLEL
jgi:glutamine amidotransferase